MTNARKAAEAIVDGYEHSQEMLDRTGAGIPQPIEKSTDHAVVLAVAYLKEHPDDGADPVTDEFMDSISRVILGHGYKLTNMLSIFNSRDGYQLYFTGGKGDMNPKPIASLKTRGDVRRVFAMLGMKAKGN